MPPDPSYLLSSLQIKTPLIGVYDAPDPGSFSPLIDAGDAQRSCIFSFYDAWGDGTTLILTRERHGCRGCGTWFFGEEHRSREAFIRFLADEEGLKASQDLMARWLEVHRSYTPEHDYLFIGPLKADQENYLKTVTIFANPDQLSALLLGAQYNHVPGKPPPVIAPFGSGCMELLPLFDDLDADQAVIGATDIAMRQHLPPDLLALTMTPSMFAQMCELDERSFLSKPFWRRLMAARRWQTGSES